MNILTTKDGTRLYFNDWGSGPPVVFSHGRPVRADGFEDQMFFLASRGCRCIAHDRRGHGRSSQPWQGNDLDTYADDLAELVNALDLKDAILVGHSTGGGGASWSAAFPRRPSMDSVTPIRSSFAPVLGRLALLRIHDRFFTPKSS